MTPLLIKSVITQLVLPTDLLDKQQERESLESFQQLMKLKDLLQCTQIALQVNKITTLQRRSITCTNPESEQGGEVGLTHPILDLTRLTPVQASRVGFTRRPRSLTGGLPTSAPDRCFVCHMMS